MTSRRSSDPRGIAPGVAPFILAMLMLSSLAFAQQTPTIFGKESEWVIWASVVMLIAASMLGIAFGLARLFAIPSLEAWTKEEFLNLLFSVVILVLFVTTAGVIESVSTSLAKDILTSTVSESGAVQYWSYIPGTGRWSRISTSAPDCPYPCQFYIARGFLGSTYEIYGESLKGMAKTHAVSLLFESFGVGTSFDLTAFVPKLDIQVGMPLYSGKAIFNNSLGTVVEELLKIVTALKVQEVGLAYLAGLSTTLFIVGIITRILWFTRKFGGLMVALGIGLYTITPLIYVLGWYTIDRSTASFNDPVMRGIEGVTIGSLGDSFAPAEVGLLFTQYDSAGRVSKLGILDSLSRAYIPIMVIPVLAIFATIGFVRQLSPMIGGDTEIAGLTRII
ncbi:Uncharacterised protein [uncultured archaeon]|nr:Uncharacterised protein [uncultured archaeon]